jgi:hypothetical protein
MNNNFVNADNSHYSGNLSSNVIPGFPGLAGAKLNIDAARSFVPGISMGGNKSRLTKRHINKITKKYKISASKIKTKKRNLRRHTKRMNPHSFQRRTSYKRRAQLKRNMRGGTIAFTPSYTTGNVVLPSNNLALANPIPSIPFSDCRDNYNHFNA